MSFPPYGTVFPTLSAFEFSWQGYAFGGGNSNPFQIQKVEGLDIENVRTGDNGRPRDHGRFVGLDLMDGRDITITGQVLLGSGPTVFQQLSAVLVPGGVTETPLFFNLPWWGTVATMARVRKHTMPLDIQADLGGLLNVVVMFSASDPRLYASPQVASATPSATTPGFTFPFTFPLVFGSGSVVGVLSADNAGNIETRPILTVTGPATSPQIILASDVSVPTLAFDMSLASGDQLVIDTDMHTATFYSAGSSQGSTALQNLVSGSTWFTLPASTTSTLQVSSGTLQCQWASAYIL